MLLVPRHGEPLEQLANGIRLAAEPNGRLMNRIVAECGRFAVLNRAGKSPHFDAWCESGAWVEAALTLAASELPNWSIRRLVKDDGIWFCALSRSPNTPFEFDDMVEASHEEHAARDPSGARRGKARRRLCCARRQVDAGYRCRRRLPDVL